MATYATRAELEQWVSDLPEVDLPDQEATERLLRLAERRVDAVVGGPVDPDELTEEQVEALSRATCAAATHLLVVGLDYYLGGPDYSPAGLQQIGPMRDSPAVIEQLAGTGLVRRKGTAGPSPSPPDLVEWST
jgi:hypothetical protein